jgi:hypothetical protein
MKKISLVLILLSFNVWANLIEEELFVYDPAHTYMKYFEHADFSIDHPNEMGYEVFGPKGTSAYIKKLGIDFSVIPKIAIKDDGYPSYTENTSTLKAIANKCSSVMRLFSIGKSVEGRELWVMKISDNVGVDEAEPEFKYISSMHGDEIVGRELTINLLKDICENYKTDARLLNIVNNTETYIMPSMNPDGSELRQRSNKNGKDLNRDFPEFTRNHPNDPRGKQPETKAVMNFQKSRNFSLSANFHGGAICVNYPWDARKSRHQFDSLLQDVSLEYANLNRDMKYSTQFPRGITNGYDWYALYGGMQDWSYIWHNDLQVTIELSNRKWADYSKIGYFYQQNRDSMLTFIEQVLIGGGFTFNDKSVSGKVSLYNNNNSLLSKFDFDKGEFYKVLSPGNYKYVIEAKGRAKTTQAFTVSKNNTVIQSL